MKLKLRLTLDVEYEVDSPDVEDYLRDRLTNILFTADTEGLFTGTSDAEVEYWFHNVERIE